MQSPKKEAHFFQNLNVSLKTPTPRKTDQNMTP